MQNPILFDKTFFLTLPDDNWTIYEDEQYTIFDSKMGVGALQISLYKTDDKVSEAALADIVSDYQIDNGLPKHLNIKNHGATSTSNFHFSQKANGKNDYWRIWHLLNKRTLLFITYNCDEKEKKTEKTQIENIIKSIEFT